MPGSGDEWWLVEPEVDLVILEAGFEALFGEFPSLDRLTVGMSKRLRVTPRYCGMANPLDCGDRYGDIVCNADARERLYWLGELAREVGALVGCCIPEYFLVVVVLRMTGSSAGSKVRDHHHQKSHLGVILQKSPSRNQLRIAEVASSL